MNDCSTKKKIVICRHTDYPNSLELGGAYTTETGTRKLQSLPLRQHLDGCESFILKTSPALWAVETAIVLNNEHGWLPDGVTAENVEYSLLSGSDIAADNDRVAHDAQQFWGGRDALIIVTHLEVCYWLPKRIARDQGWPEDGEWQKYVGLDRGMAAVLDLTEQTISVVQSPPEDT